MRIRHLRTCLLVIGASMLVACASSPRTPEQLGFRSKTINGQQYFCGAPEAVAPAYHFRTQELCLTAVQWPYVEGWGTMRPSFNGMTFQSSR